MEMREKWVSFYGVNQRHLTKNVKIVMCLFVLNFLSYVSAEYYLNWFTVGKVITKITRCSAIAERPRCRVHYSFRQK